MNRTIKEAAVKRFHYDSHDQLCTHLAKLAAPHRPSGHGRLQLRSRLKTLNGLKPYEYIAKIWTSEPERFILNLINQMTGLNS